MRRAFLILMTFCAASTWAATVDFHTVAPGYADGSQGPSLQYGGVAIAAKTQLPQGGDPLPPVSQGTAANVYWGTLGNLGISGQAYTGLGVQRTTQSGTTGRPIDANEALVFTFAQPVLLQSVRFTVDGLVNTNGTTDNFAVRVSTLLQGHGGVNSAGLVTSATQTFDLGISPFWPGAPFASTLVDVISIQSVSGVMGVRDLAFAAPVPEPAEWAMLLAGLLVVGYIAHRKVKLA